MNNLGDRYQLPAELGRGGMSTAHRARDLRHNRDVAILLLLLVLPAVAADQDTLLQMHRDVLRYHVENDLDAWMADESDDHVIVSRGEISQPTIAERRARLKPYLDGATFSVYRDLVDPIVKVSDDGSLGWVICQVEVEGVSGEEQFRDVWAWIELYEKREGAWLRVGNVSSLKPETQ